jgi:hypothetical protein
LWGGYLEIDQETREWIKKNVNLIHWLMVADKKVDHGTIVIRYHQGKIIGYDICPRERIDLKSKNIVI